MTKYYFYTIKSQINDNLYKGISKDPYKRLREHNLGKTRSIKSGIPYRLVYIEECKNSLEAREREKYYKSGCGREQLKTLIDHK